MERRVVITGIGALTPVGKELPEIWNNLTNGVSGISEMKFEEEGDFKIDVKIAGQIKDFSINSYFSPDEKANSMYKDMDRVSLIAMAAAKNAINDSGILDEIAKGNLKPERVASFVGSGVGGISTTSKDIATLLSKGPKRVGVRTIIRLMANAPAGQINIEFGFKGRAKCEVTACASGLDAILDAYNNVKFGLADITLAGGSEAPVMPLAVASFANMRALSKRDVPPQEASCPFSADRDGFVISEGAVLFVLEERERAIKRGAKIYGEIIGGAGSCDAYHITAPHPEGEGAAQAMREALQTAGLKPEEIDLIHAHGTSTPLNDERETLAIKKVFEAHAKKLAVISTKSMTGHMIAAAGPMGVLVGTQVFKTGIIPPTINYKNPDPVCDLDYVPNKARENKNVNAVMVNALGFGGHNTSVIVKRHS